MSGSRPMHGWRDPPRIITSDWQPITTAPKDGRHVLLFVRYSNAAPEQIVGYWPYPGRPDMDEIGSWNLVQAGSWAEDSSVSGDPTHWMPLHEPPGETA